MCLLPSYSIKENTDKHITQTARQVGCRGENRCNADDRILTLVRVEVRTAIPGDFNRSTWEANRLAL
jgi:hypothetical protein